jgi:hypothetical protein
MAMHVRVSQGEVAVEWNDRGDEAGQYPLNLFVEGLCYRIRHEQTLRDLYESLAFLYEKRG